MSMARISMVVIATALLMAAGGRSEEGLAVPEEPLAGGVQIAGTARSRVLIVEGDGWLDAGQFLDLAKAETFPAFPCVQDGGTATGNTTVTGTIFFKNPSGTAERCTYCKIDVRDFDDWGPGDEPLNTVHTDVNGNFSATIANRDVDVGGKVDVYLRIWTTNPGRGSVRMTNGQVYGYQTGMKACNVPNGTVALGSIFLDTNGHWARAFRAFRIVGLSWFNARTNAGSFGIDTGPVNVIYPADGWSSTLGAPHPHQAVTAHYHDVVREIHIGSGRLETNDVAMYHEMGHHVMTGVGYPLLQNTPACPIILDEPPLFGVQAATDCAWREGWAELWAAKVSGLTVLPRGAKSFDIEKYVCPGYTCTAAGPRVPARIAAALYDMLDVASDGLDQHSSTFDRIFQVFHQSRLQFPGSTTQPRDFQNFYFWWDGFEYPPANVTLPAQQNTITLP